ncbi:fatty-acid-binding protein 2 [Daucus carota subsp. sativus]|uniref:fatty-acid-binding protein 2 n=1 Tax=Daucus carota subsp. sativus TaxID=79200 RepID=UPI0007EF370B|nr:PREDICTED: fatty-acid-binding protein 2-like [Daucus carota subsp. sativus]
MDLDRWFSSAYPPEPLVHPYLLSQISSFVDNSLQHSGYLYMSGSMAIRDAFNCMSKYSSAMLLCFAGKSNFDSNLRSPGEPFGSYTRSCKSYARVNYIASARHNISILGRTFRLTGKSFIPVLYKFTNSSLGKLCEHPPGELQSISMLSLAAALVPSLDKVSMKPENELYVQMEKETAHMQGCTDQSPSKVEHQGCDDICFNGKINGSRHIVEPSTGIEFPAILDDYSAHETNYTGLSEVLVGTGSKTMKIIKIKSLKVYAFGFYVHPCDVCEKLGSSYSSIAACELDKRHSLYQDLLREDIGMTVRLVVSVNGIKISTVKNAFEKSLRARLMKTNPNNDLDCLKKFGSLFSQDYPICAGTTIYIRRTVDGHLITEIGGHQIGAVHSRDLCRAFFDMYIGDLPICAETKDEIGRNVATILGHC